MTVLYVPERGWIFAGDLFISRRLRYMRNDEDPNALICSLEKVLALDFETLFCAHRGVIKDGRAQLQAKLDYLTGLRRQVQELGRQGLSARQITRRALGREEVIYYISGGRFSAINFVRSFLARPEHPKPA
jgi:glyoxylase-like metal-dependent hydrolase (beta-lactamase superfamily II)